MNKIFLIGNVGKDADLKTSANGKNYSTFTLAITEKYNGETTTDWHYCKMWGKTAENLTQYIRKGDKILVEGKQKNEKYQGKTIPTVHVVTVEFLGGGQRKPAQAPQQQQAQPSQEDNLPF